MVPEELFDPLFYPKNEAPQPYPFLQILFFINPLFFNMRLGLDYRLQKASLQGFSSSKNQEIF